jgi:hypothetical protein
MVCSNPKRSPASPFTATVCSLYAEVHSQTAGMAGPQRDKTAYGKDDFAIQHTHPNASSDKPSANEVEAAKKIK